MASWRTSRLQRQPEHPAPSGEPAWASQGCHLLGRDPNSQEHGRGPASHPCAGWAPLGLQDWGAGAAPQGSPAPQGWAIAAFGSRLGCSVAGSQGSSRRGRKYAVAFLHEPDGHGVAVALQPHVGPGPAQTCHHGLGRAPARTEKPDGGGGYQAPATPVALVT